MSKQEEINSLCYRVTMLENKLDAIEANLNDLRDLILHCAASLINAPIHS